MPSSVIRRFDYDAARRRLSVTFTSGDRYDYEAVPPAVADGLRAASSRGRYFSENIRDRFAFERHPRVD